MVIDRKQMIIEAATKSFSLFGYKATTMDQVAKLANVGKGTIYTFFKNKEELFDEIMLSLMKEMKVAAAETIDSSLKFHENLHR
ncbi:MAG: helix-turn-helix domain-containing protein, partial [Bacillus sp. (in: firmicutes)]